MAGVFVCGIAGTPERVVLQLEVVQAPGLRFSCIHPAYAEGASFYSRAEILPGFRSEARGNLAAAAGKYRVEMELDQ